VKEAVGHSSGIAARNDHSDINVHEKTYESAEILAGFDGKRTSMSIPKMRR
jgi:hypothetical protein